MGCYCTKEIACVGGGNFAMLKFLHGAGYKSAVNWDNIHPQVTVLLLLTQNGGIQVERGTKREPNC